MCGFFLGAKYVDMGIFWNLYLMVLRNSSKIISKPPIIIENLIIWIKFANYHKWIVKNPENVEKYSPKICRYGLISENLWVNGIIDFRSTHPRHLPGGVHPGKISIMVLYLLRKVFLVFWNNRDVLYANTGEIFADSAISYHRVQRGRSPPLGD